LPGDQQTLWIHAVSVGEVQAAVPLVRALRSGTRDLRILVTTTTPTGRARVQQALGDSVLHRYAPYDLPGVVRRFLERVRPRLVIIMETELWPNILHQCARRQIPVLLANARLSAHCYYRGPDACQRQLHRGTNPPGRSAPGVSGSPAGARSSNWQH
jgi:3-deoxy-D-manno-octulosonic-acid transferase